MNKLLVMGRRKFHLMAIIALTALCIQEHKMEILDVHKMNANNMMKLLWMMDHVGGVESICLQTQIKETVFKNRQIINLVLVFHRCIALMQYTMNQLTTITFNLLNQIQMTITETMMILLIIMICRLYRLLVMHGRRNQWMVLFVLIALCIQELKMEIPDVQQTNVIITLSSQRMGHADHVESMSPPTKEK